MRCRELVVLTFNVKIRIANPLCITQPDLYDSKCTLFFSSLTVSSHQG